MPENAENPTDRPRHGCMECHAQQPYTVERFPNGNTGWRCVVCGHILNLLPGTYTSGLVETGDGSTPETP